MTVFVKLTTTELRLLVREPLAIFFAVLFPTALVVILGAIRVFREPVPELGGLRIIDLYVGIAVTLVLAMLGLQMLPAALATYREKGVLRRLATTPVHPVALLGAQLVANLLVAVVAAALCITVGYLVYDVQPAANMPAFLIAFLLSGAGVFAIGLLVAALVPTGKAGNAVGTLLFFPSMFFAGLWAPRESMPATVQRIGDFTPLGAAERALHEAMTGSWPNPLSVAVLLGYLLICGVAASRLFQWS
ncbi:MULTISPECIES: ABC transporter permease [Actinoplanes]|uniref:ABC transporter permease n=1 Tax=Actinoplanes TaxID=1865 RepID=UPI0005F2ADA2|nr:MULTISPECIES: ABC transporter permease [Actinoplanes]GLY06157.1 transport permease protein [Actinoplanes sp. NBRC 101535]